MSVKWKAGQSLEDLGQALIEHVSEMTNEGLMGVAQEYAPQIQSHMKQTAPWTDRTGDARRTLYAKAEERPKGAAIEMGHGVHYGVWLEIRWQGRFAVVFPGMVHWSSIIMRDLQGRMA